jgi:hypothetical protein
MGVTVSLPLFGNPGRELEEGEPINSRQLRKLATDLSDRLSKAADMIDKLAADGWTNDVAMFDVLLYHPQIQTQEQAIGRLESLALDPELFLIVEDVEDGEDM